MKKVFLFISIWLLFFNVRVQSCSSFSFKKGNEVVMAKSYDWSTNIGVLLTNNRGEERIAYPTGKNQPMKWTSKYGSITFNQFGQFLPNGGINEKGLAVEVLWLNDTEYCTRNKGNTLNELQWVQYQLDNCASVAEVIETNKNMYVIPIFAKLHFFVADKAGNATVIEYINGKFTAYTGKNLPYKGITNDTYQKSLNYYKNIEKFKIKRHNASLNRFSRVAQNISNYEKTVNDSSVVDLAFSILDKVWVKNWTKWNIVYDLTNLKIHFRTNDYRDIKTVDFNRFNYTKSNPVWFININNLMKEDISSLFKEFTKKTNLSLLKNSTRIVGVPLADDFIEIMALHPQKIEKSTEMFKNLADTIGNLIIEITNLKTSNGYVYLGIAKGEDNFKNNKNFNGAVVAVNNKSARAVIYNIPINKEYAIGFYHDENNNRRLDKNKLGIPKESYGFSNNKGRKYKNAKFQFTKSGQVLKIKGR